MTTITKGVERSRTRIQGFADPEMEFQLQRGLGAATQGGASMGELLIAAETIRALSNGQSGHPRDAAQSWVQAHSDLAERVEALGRKALERKHLVSARDHLLRASMYYRAAEYYCDPFEPQHLKWGLASRQAFILGAGLLAASFRVVEIPYQDIFIPAYFMQPDDDSHAPRKTLIVNTGFDGSGEELYFVAGRLLRASHRRSGAEFSHRRSQGLRIGFLSA